MGGGSRQSGYLGPDLETLQRDSAELDRWLEDTSTRSIDAMRTGGRRVVLLEPTPYGADQPDILACLSDAEVVEECRFVADVSSTNSEDLYRRLDAEDDELWAVDLDQLVCPYLPICDPIIDGLVVQTDTTHLTSAFARSLAPALDAYLVSTGVLP